MDVKEILLIIALAIVLIVATLFASQKYKNLNHNSNYKTEIKEEIKEEQKEETEEKVEDTEELINRLYKMVSIDDVNKNNMGYYESDSVTIGTINDELLSYLILKNLDLRLNGEPEKEVKIETIDKVLKKIFNKDEIKLSYYEAPVNNYLYSLNYVGEFEVYVLSRERKKDDDTKLTKKIKDYDIKDDKLIINEEYTAIINKKETKGTLKYTFKKGAKDYYLLSVERKSK